ncbi:hypothetical protein Lal_00011374 [Lupinus albus]|nr:hypothetical protein Lal_00011374 [Lupinus albus]
MAYWRWSSDQLVRRTFGNSFTSLDYHSLNDLVLLRSLNNNIRLDKAPRIIEVIWVHHAFGWIKANTNGAALGYPRISGGGGIFRDHKWCCIMLFLSSFIRLSKQQTWLLREGNACADKLAFFGVVNKRNSFWNHLPNFIKDVYHRNRFGLLNYRFRNFCGSLAQARVSPKPKSASRLSERITLKRQCQDFRANSLWVSRLSERIALKQQFQA